MGPSLEWGRQIVTKPHLEVPGEPLERRDRDTAHSHLHEAPCGDRAQSEGSQDCTWEGPWRQRRQELQAPWLGSVICRIFNLEALEPPREPAHQLSPPPPPSSRGTSEAGSLFLCPGASVHVGLPYPISLSSSCPAF